MHLTSQRLLGVGIIRLKYFNIIRYTPHEVWNASAVVGSGQGVHGAVAIRAENRLMIEYCLCSLKAISLVCGSTFVFLKIS